MSTCSKMGVRHIPNNLQDRHLNESAVALLRVPGLPMARASTPRRNHRGILRERERERERERARESPMEGNSFSPQLVFGRLGGSVTSHLIST